MGSVTNSPKAEDGPGVISPEFISADFVSGADLPPAQSGPLRPLGNTTSTKRRNRVPVASLTARILAINVLALAIVVAGYFYLDRYQSDLFDAKLAGLSREGALIAGAIGERVVPISLSVGGPISGARKEKRRMDYESAKALLRRLALSPDIRVRLFNTQGELIVDSSLLRSAGVQTRELPAPGEEDALSRAAIAVYDWLVEILPPHSRFPRQAAPTEGRASDFPEAARALEGETTSAIRETEEGSLVAVAALPVQPLRRTLGALLISSGAEDVLRSVRDVRFTVLEAFAVALAITILLSLYFARTITTPVRRLAEAAEQVRAGRGRKVSIPDFTARRDEIGGLSRALRGMTQTLWVRMDAIEVFVADVAHEIKNPLSSLRNAVETARRVNDPGQRDKLLDIVAQDVTRLDRLLSEIADASRIDTEMLRAEAKALELGGVLSALVEMHRHAAEAEHLNLTLDLADERPFMVYAVEDRLVQVFQNLLNNARSFSPPGGEIIIRMKREDDEICIDIDDDGPGVAESLREAIFDRFYTLRPKSEPFGAHSGLGLSISRQIIDAHSGTICCTKRPDEEGARFTVRLPAVRDGET